MWALFRAELEVRRAIAEKLLEGAAALVLAAQWLDGDTIDRAVDTVSELYTAELKRRREAN